MRTSRKQIGNPALIRRRFAAMSCLLLAAFLMLAWAGPALAENCLRAGEPTWLLGDWRADAETTVFLEHWELGTNGWLIGHAESRMKGADQIDRRESMWLRSRDGNIYYEVELIGEQGLVAFRLVNCEDGQLVFENPEHDFPKRITYRRATADRFEAEVANLEGQGFRLEFVRIAPAN